MSTESTSAFGGRSWGYLFDVLRRQRLGLATAIVIGLGWTLGKIGVPQLTRIAIDRSIEGDDPVRTSVLLLTAAGVGVGLFTGLRRYYAFRESRLVETRLREQLFDHVLDLHVGYHDRAQTGQLMSRMSSDLNQVQSFVAMIPITITNLALILGALTAMFLTDPVLALAALVPLPFVNFVGKRFSQAIYPVSMRIQSEQAQLSNVVEETIAGVRVIKGFGAEGVQAKRLATEANDIMDASLDSARIRARFMPLVELLPSLGIISVLWVGGNRVLDGHLTIGELVTFNMYVALLVQPLRALGMVIAWAQRASVALTRMHEVLGSDPAIVDPAALSAAALQPPQQGAVKFHDVHFGYNPAEPVLCGLDLDIAPGESVAIVGGTGSGKTTIARLLLRFYDPQSGFITLDGVDLRERRVHDVRRNVGMVFEDTLLFHDTVAANIAFVDPDASHDLIVRAAELAGAADFIADLPEGYDTLLGERGFSLSGGQRQRIAIARAILGDPRVLVLDDATSAVDPTKEHEIRSAMATVMNGRTTIVIAHRPGTIAMADRVVLLHEGVIAASGTHEHLLVSDQRYRSVLAAMSTPVPEPDSPRPIAPTRTGLAGGID